jgi:hypothetical protein
MKTVFSNSQVCHVFISQAQAQGRNSSSSIYFENDVIYSYGSHYVMGRVYLEKNLLLMNEFVYSPSTGQHRSHLFRAARHLDTIQVPRPENTSSDIEENTLYLENEIFEEFSRALGCLTGINFHLDQLEEKINTLNKYLDLFGDKKRKVILNDDFLSFLEELREVKREKEVIKEEKKREKREADRKAREEAAAKREIENIEKLNNWKEGKPIDSSLYVFYHLPVALRINYFKRIVETSHGAEVPLKEAVKAAGLFFSNKEKLLNKRIGHFQVNRFSSDRLEVGCHSIPFEEITRVFGPILERLEELRKSEESEFISPNYVADFFYNRGLELNSDEITLLSDLA